jgi:glycosyltransferase involved in cell wall biosynthesis
MSINKKKTVLFLPAWYPNRTHLSVGSFVRSHAETVNSELKVDVLVVCGDEQLKKIFELQHDVINNVNTYFVYFRKAKSKNLVSQFLKAVLYVFGQFYGYYFYRKTNPRPTFFHVHVLTRAAILAFLLKYFRGVSYYITEHWSRYLPQDNSYRGWIRKILTKLIVKKSSGVSAVSENLKLNMIRHGLRHPNFQVISNVTESIFFEHYPIHHSDNVEFIHVSNFASCKNVKGILEAVNTLNNRGFIFSFKILGDGIDYELARKHAEYLRLSNVTFKGFVYGKKVVEAIHNATAMVLFSDYENQPVVITEALSLGVPVIATAVGGIPEMISADNGILIAPKDIDGLADAMEKVISNKVNFDKDSIRVDAFQHFHPSVIAQQFLNFYRSGGAEV